MLNKWGKSARELTEGESYNVVKRIRTIATNEGKLDDTTRKFLQSIIVARLRRFKKCFRCKKCSEMRKNCRLSSSSVRYKRMLEERVALRKESREFRERLSKIDERMTEMEDMEDETMAFEQVMDEDGLELAESPGDNTTQSVQVSVTASRYM